VRKTGEDELRILLVEDNPADIMLVEEALREHNVAADMQVISDGDAAYSYWDQFFQSGHAPCPNLVLLDLNLPKRSGLEILQRIRETPLCVQTRVIIISSSTNTRDRRDTADLGIYHYFRKPTHFEEFLELGRIIKRLEGEQMQVQA